MSDILANSSLTGIGRSALGMLMANEVSGSSDKAFSVSKPVAGKAAGNSGWAIGATQLDFLNNSTQAQALLVAALGQAINPVNGNNYFTTNQAQQIAQAFTAAGTGEAVNFTNVAGGAAINVALVNAALNTPGAQQVIQRNADIMTTSRMNDVDAAVARITNADVKAQLTPGTSTFSPTAYLALIDYSNQFGGISANGPMQQFLQGMLVTFKNANGTQVGGTIQMSDIQGGLAEKIQTAVRNTYYVKKSGSDGGFNASAFDTIVGRQLQQNAFGRQFQIQSGQSAENDSGSSAGLGMTTSYQAFAGDLGLVVRVVVDGKMFLSSHGDGAVVSTDTSGTIFSSGDNAIIAAAAGSVISITGNGIVLSTSNSTIVESESSSLNVAGHDDSIAVASGANLGLLGGTGFLVSATGATINTLGNTSLNVAGGDDVIGLGGTGDYLGLLGGSGYTVSANQSTISTLANTQVNLFGGNDTVALGTGSSLALVGGSGWLVNANGATITTSGNTSLNVAGGNDSIALGGTGNTLGLLNGTGYAVAGTQ